MKINSVKTVMLCLSVLAAGFLTGLPLMAQSGSRTVTGLVISDGEPVIGAAVTVKGTLRGTVTDIDGRFSLEAAPDAILAVSSIGYVPAEIPVSGRGYVEITIDPDIISLQDVVVVGYGVQKKVNMTGAVSSVSTDELDGKPIINALEGLQGTTPGFIIRQGSSTPGSSPSMNIRGLNTMNNNDPLVIIDGIEGSLANLNPNDIDRISILKDASSTAIYGSRASNGVVLVTTKTGKNGKVEIAYDFNYGFQQPTSLPKVADSWIYAELYNEAAVNSGRSTKFTAEDIAGFRNGGTNVKWIREIYKNYAPQMSHNVSMTGGTQNLSYMASLGYTDQDSMFKGPDYGYKKYTARLNLTHKVTDKFILSMTSQFARNDIREHAYWTEWLIEQPNRMPPIYEIKNPDGTYTYPAGSNSNSLERLEQGGYRRGVNDELAGTLKAEWEVYKGLKLIGSIGGRTWNNVQHENRKSTGGSGDTENHINENFYRSLNITSNVMASYDATFGKHTVGALAGFQYEGFSDKSFSTQRITEDSKYDVLGSNLSGNDVSNSGSAGDWSMYSWFARVTYNYAERYLLEFNLRNDYSSYFAKGNRSGLFPSVSVGWRMSKENFWDNIRQYVPEMKLRGSWGLVGNNRIGAYQYMQTVSVSGGATFGDKIAETAWFASANPFIKWETTRMADIGLDVTLLKDGNLDLSFDLFSNKTKNILVNLPVPDMFGNGAPIQNAGVVGTWGWEIAANYRLRTGAVHHTFSANVSDSRNKVIDTNGTETIGGGDVNTIIKEGYPLFSYYAYKSDGFFRNEAECAAGPHLDGITPKPGDIRYIDKNGDGLIKEDDDRFIVGNDFPRYLYGFSYGLEFKGFFFSMMWQGVGRRSRWMRGEAVEAFHNNNEGPVLDFHIDRWTPDNPDATYPRLTMGSESSNNAAKSDFWIQDASYLRLKNVQLGYMFPEKWMKKIRVKDLRIYASVQNALTFSKMKGGWDPEYNADGSGRAYPVARVYSLGLNLKF